MQIRIFFVYSHHHKHNYKDSAMMRGTGKRPSFLLFANTNFRVKPPELGRLYLWHKKSPAIAEDLVKSFS